MTPVRLVQVTLAAALALGASPWAVAADLPTAPAQAASGTAASAFDGVVEAVRQTVVAAQVPGAVVRLDGKVGKARSPRLKV